MLVFDPKKAMKYVTAEGIAASAMFAVMNSFLTVFAAALGASNTQIGMVVAVPAIVALLSYIPAAFAIENWNKRRITCTLFSMLSRIMWIFVGLMPFLILWNVLHGIGEAVTLLIIIISVYYLFAAFVGPAWASMVGVIIPENARGSYFGRRNQLCAVASLASGTVAGLVLQAYGENLLGFAIIFMGAGIAGLFSSFFFSRFPDIKFQPEKIRLFSELRMAFSNKGFRRFMLVFMLWQFGVSMSAPFMNVYLIQGMGAEYFWISIIIFVSGITTIIFQKGWGTVSDVFGHRSIMIISAFGAAFIPLLWMIAPSPEFTILINIVSGLSWAGFDIANFNYMLEITTGGKRTIYSAIYWTMIGIPLIIAPVAGGMMADALASVPLQLFSGFRGMFFVSWIVRMVAVGLFAYLLVEVSARSRVPARYVAKEVISIGFHTVEQPFHFFRKYRFGYTQLVAMRMLNGIKKIGRKRK